MMLIGKFDSPFVRRVAISMRLLEMPFEHRNWSVGREFERIREFNPLGRVPVLLLDDGTALVESAMILDHLDQQAGPARALLPASGAARRQALHIMALATGATDKGLQLVYEEIFRPAEKHHAPWTDRCRGQMHGALAELERLSGAAKGEWLIGDALCQADITLACYATFLGDAIPVDLATYPALQARVERCEALPVFGDFRVPFDAPVPTAAAPA